MPETAQGTTGQLYNLATDPGETKKPLTPGPPTHGHAESNFLSVIDPSQVRIGGEVTYFPITPAIAGTVDDELTQPAKQQGR